MVGSDTSIGRFEVPYVLARPIADSQSPVLVTSPHSGADYPEDFIAASMLDAHELRQSEDMYVDTLFAEAPKYGATLLAARYPRSFVDLNRGANEIDPDLVDDLLPVHREQSLPRVQAGLGAIPRIVAEDTPIYADKLQLADVEARMTHIYHPFHKVLMTELELLRAPHASALLIDAHSMPSLAARHVAPRNQAAQIDIVLGTCHGRSCSDDVAEFISQHFRRAGYTIALNRPYAGGYITSHYGRPRMGTHAVQIEINRALYMNETSYEKTANFDILKADISTLIAALANAMPALAQSHATIDTKAAE